MAFGDLVQSKTATGASGEASVTLDAGATAGNLLKLTVTRSALTATTGDWGSITDWTNGPRSPGNSGNMGGAVWWKIATGGETAVTTAMTDETGNWTAIVEEYEGAFAASPHDQSNDDETHISSTTTSQATGDITTTQNDALLLASFGIDNGANFGTRQYTNSFTETVVVTSGGRAGTVCAKRVVAATGTYGSTLSYSAGGTTDEMYGAIISFKKDTGNPPTVALNTADATAFTTTTPTLEFTATDAEGNDVRYQIQIANNNDFASGTNIVDSYEGGGSGTPIHPGPHPTNTTWEGNPQVDDRPMQSFDSGGGGVLSSVQFQIGNDQSGTIAGSTYGRIYTHSGTFGTSSAPANAAAQADTPTPGWLAKTDGVLWDDDEPLSATWYVHAFSGAQQIQIPPDTKYMVGADWVPTGSIVNTNTVAFSNDGSGGTHGGNAYIDGDSPNYGVQASYDLYFRVSLVQTLDLDKTSNVDAGFANTVTGGDTDPFTEDEKCSFTVQGADALDNGTYYWRVRAMDPAGSGGFGAWSSTRSFTVTATASPAPALPMTFVGPKRSPLTRRPA